MVQWFDELSEKLSAVLPEQMQGLKNDAKKNFKAVLESSFAKMNIVTREEFDAQRAVLARARETLDLLEQKVTQLEQQHKT